MAYDPYNDNVTDDWTFASQVAIWRERALHSAERAAFWKRLAEAEANGTTINPSGKEPKIQDVA